MATELAKENVSHLRQLKNERHAFLDAANLCVQRLAVGSLPLANNVLLIYACWTFGPHELLVLIHTYVCTYVVWRSHTLSQKEERVWSA